MRVLAYNKASSWFGHRLRPLARPPLYQGLVGLVIFFSLGFLYGLGSWLASQNPTLLDVKTTQEGFLEVSKILGDPRTTTHPPMILPPLNAAALTRDLYASKWIRKVNVCQQKKRLSLLVTVISAPYNLEERNAIRRGWGKTASESKNVAFAFVVGKPSNDKMDELISESDKFQDLIIIDHLDTYNNLTLKTLAAFDYLLSTCPQAQYLLKTDDDMFIQVKRLLALIRGLHTTSDELKEIIVGNVASGWVPVRNPQSKYFITEEQYSEATYPPFVTGPSYLVSKTAVNHLFEAALEHPFLHLEDVFLTGIIAEQVGVPRRLAIEFRNNAVRIPAQFLGCTLLRTISIHKVLASEQEKLSQMAKNPQCGKKSGK